LATKFSFTRNDKHYRIQKKALYKLLNFYKLDKDYEVREYVDKEKKKLKAGTSIEEVYRVMSKAALEKAAELLNKTEEEVMKDKVYVMSKERLAAIRRDEKQRMYIEITKMLDLFYPDFWGDTPLDEQIKWIMQVERKKEDFAQMGNSQGSLEKMAHICAIIGIDFDSKPEHRPIYTFLQSDIVDFSTDALDYLYFVYLERDYEGGGIHLNGWSMRDALGHLPYPKRHVPRFSDELPNGKSQNFDYSIWRIYKDLIREGGKQDYDRKRHEVIRAYMKTLKPVSVTLNKNKD